MTENAQKGEKGFRNDSCPYTVPSLIKNILIMPSKEYLKDLYTVIKYSGSPKKK
tara:strand:+ start:224 stop:385 length:162 start_codon:yes stop_codon:yes gene_type:complete